MVAWWVTVYMGTKGESGYWLEGDCIWKTPNMKWKESGGESGIGKVVGVDGTTY